MMFVSVNRPFLNDVLNAQYMSQRIRTYCMKLYFLSIPPYPIACLMFPFLVYVFYVYFSLFVKHTVSNFLPKCFMINRIIVV